MAFLTALACRRPVRVSPMVHQMIQARHRLEAAQARSRVQERKARTRRLIQEGAILESVWPEVRDIPMADLPRKLHDKLSNAP